MTNTKPGPITVVLTQSNLEVICRVSYEDETTKTLDVQSLSMRGGQREITGWLIAQGYRPHGRWETDPLARDADGNGLETVREFRGPERAESVPGSL